MGACCGRPSGAACSQLAAAGLLLSAADWALLRGRGVTGAAAVLALGDEGLGCALQLRSDPSCFSVWGCQCSIRVTCDLLRRKFTS
jgi:hypothetical protein